MSGKDGANSHMDAFLSGQAVIVGCFVTTPRSHFSSEWVLWSPLIPSIHEKKGAAGVL